MPGDIRELLSRLPAAKKIDQAACEHLDKEIRNGVDLNTLQREMVYGVVQFCLEQNELPPPPYESFLAFTYIEWTDEARRSEEAKPRLLDFVRRLKAAPPLASAVGQLAQKVAQEREGRRKRERERLAAVLEAGPSANSLRKGGFADPPNVLVKKMQQARHGGG